MHQWNGGNYGHFLFIFFMDIKQPVWPFSLDKSRATTTPRGCLKPFVFFSVFLTFAVLLAVFVKASVVEYRFRIYSTFPYLTPVMNF